VLTFGIDTSGQVCSAALLRDGAVVAQRADEGKRHSVALMPLCDEVFREAGVRPRDIGCYAVSCGPGSFTGLRIGIGAVKGLAFPFDTPCVPVPTLEVLALSACPTDRLILPVIDARRQRVYTAAFRQRGDGVVRIEPDSVADIREVSEKYGGTGALLVGSGASLWYNEDGWMIAAGRKDFTYAALAGLAAQSRLQKGETVPAQDLQADYLLLTQAERERKERLP